MFNELKNKTDEAIRTRQFIGFLVMIISFSAFFFFFILYIRYFSVGHPGELIWSLYTAIPSFCLFLLATYYERTIIKERKRRIEEDELEETKKNIYFGWVEIIVVSVIGAIMIPASFLYLGFPFTFIVIAILGICGIKISQLIYSPIHREWGKGIKIAFWIAVLIVIISIAFAVWLFIRAIG